MTRPFIAATALGLSLASSVGAQSMAGMDMKGMSMPAPQPAKKATPAPAPRKRAGTHRLRVEAAAPHRSVPHAPAPAQSPMPGMDMSGSTTMPGMPMPGPGSPPVHDMAAMPGMQHQAGAPMPGMDINGQPVGTDLAPGNAPAPAPPMDHYADRTYDRSAMDHARAVMMRDDGGRIYHKVLLNLAEFQAHAGRNGYRWDGEAWIGGDRNRLFLKSEGEGAFRGGVDSAEVQALYSRAIGPYFNLQAGVRHDFRPGPSRTYATLGFEGLAPYMFETEAALFLSEKGDLLGRLEGWHDAHLTQRLVLQPRVELNLSAQNVPEDRYGSGLVDAELGLRLRYEIRREFAPYVGVSWQRKVGRTADYARADGERVGGPGFVAGLRIWF